MHASPVAGFELVCAIGELPTVGAALAQVGDKRVAMVHTQDGKVHAVQDTCTHGAVSLSEGEVDGNTLECWLHGSRFDLISGRPLCPPATAPLEVYEVQLRGEEVWVDVNASAHDKPDNRHQRTLANDKN
ncbi:MAG: non-heme iron oxygenase ferredoxin subunit [Micrococcales bacterium]|nr:non-heme iron oxygenase ferredoxin subunit [Micrococcales bacterium]